MMYADTDAGRVEATPGGRGTCPSCWGPTIAKCGSIVVHHWAHAAGDDCDTWSEPESPWHRRWKSYYAGCGASVEVPMGTHRADVVTAGGGVVELQHSPIALAEALEREHFYGRMLWLFDMTDEDRWSRVHFGRRGFWWKHGSKTQTRLRRPVFWHDPAGMVHRVSLSVVETSTGSHRIVGRFLASYVEADFLDLTQPRVRAHAGVTS